MNFSLVFQVSLIVLLLITTTATRTLRYDQSDEEDTSDLFVNEADTNDNDEFKSPDVIYNDNDNADIDSYEERKFYERAASSTLRPHFISAKTREALIDILQKAVHKGWHPPLKHYNPSTRFGRHRR